MDFFIWEIIFPGGENNPQYRLGKDKPIEKQNLICNNIYIKKIFDRFFSLFSFFLSLIYLFIYWFTVSEVGKCLISDSR
jgi:hypothetical protein